jgi:hypothetical protein
MSEWSLAAQFFLGLSVLAFLLLPLIKRIVGQSIEAGPTDEEETELTDAFVQVMSDLEYDYETGKISEEDYNRLRGEVFRERGPEAVDIDDESVDEEGLEEAVRRAREDLDL